LFSVIEISRNGYASMYISFIPDHPENAVKSGFPFDVRANNQMPATAMGFEEILSLRIGDQGNHEVFRQDDAPRENNTVELNRRDIRDTKEDSKAAAVKDDTSPADSREAVKEVSEGKKPEKAEQAPVPEEKREAKTGEEDDAGAKLAVTAGARAEVKKAASPSRAELAGLLSDLAEKLAGFMNKSHTGPDTKEIMQGIKNTVDAAGRHLKEGNDRKAAALIKTLVERLATLRRKIEDGAGQPKSPAAMALNRQVLIDTESLTAAIKKITAKIAKAAGDKPGESAAKAEARVQPDFTALQRPVAGKGDAPDNGSQFQQGNQGMNFTVLRQGKGVDAQAPAPGLLKNPLFDEQLQQITQHARVVVQDGRNGTFTVRLYPESLGKVNISLGLEQGTLSGRFLVDSPEVKQALLEQLNTVREHLADAGVTVGEFQVNVRDGGDRGVFGENHERRPRLLNEAGNAAMNFEYASAPRHDGAIDVII